MFVVHPYNSYEFMVATDDSLFSGSSYLCQKFYILLFL